MPYLIDGNNVLGRVDTTAPRDPRADLVPRVAEFCRRQGARATLVFDGPPFREDLVGPQFLGDLTLRFAGADRDADSLIEALVKRHDRPAELTVVTSDKALYERCRSLGARAMRVRQWIALERRASSRHRRPHEEDSEKPERETDVEGWLEVFEGRSDDS